MKKLTVFLIIVLLTQAALLPVSAESPEVEEAAYNGYLVKLAENAPAFLNDTLEYVVPNVYWSDDAATVMALQEYGLAEHVEPNYKVTLFETSTEQETAEMPWAHTSVHAEAAAELGLSGEGVRVAVIDSGLQTDNPNLDHAIVEEGYDYILGTSAMTDTVGHGTYVTQMIVGDGDDGAMKGIAPKASIVPFRCFSEKTADTSLLIRAVADAADPNKFACDVINMSWGSDTKSTLLEAELQKAYDAGVLLVAAAGNVQTNTPQGTVIYPAALDTVIGVGAIDAGSNAPEFSQQTIAVDVSAPGTTIPLCSLAGESVYASGTSFAAPCVAAILALIDESAPDMPPAFAKNLLCQNAVDFGETGRDNAYGYGLTDLSVLLGKSAWTAVDHADGTASCWLPAAGTRTVYAAAYNSAGRMRDISNLTLESGTFWGICEITTNKNLFTKFFVLDETLIPCDIPLECTS